MIPNQSGGTNSLRIGARRPTRRIFLNPKSFSMTFSTLLFRTLLYHWRTNLAVCLGVIAGTAVIGGALIVGDSVRGSLRDMTLARLAPVGQALTRPRFFREQLAADLQPTTRSMLGITDPENLLYGRL